MSTTCPIAATCGRKISNQGTLCFDSDDDGSNESCPKTDGSMSLFGEADETSFTLSCGPFPEVPILSPPACWPWRCCWPSPMWRQSRQVLGPLLGGIRGVIQRAGRTFERVLRWHPASWKDFERVLRWHPASWKDFEHVFRWHPASWKDIERVLRWHPASWKDFEHVFRWHPASWKDFEHVYRWHPASWKDFEHVLRWHPASWKELNTC